MSVVGLLVRRNARWIVAFAFVFVYVSAILSNASSLSQWYSTKVSDEIQGFADNDFVVSQTGMLDMVEEVHGRLAALENVRYIVTMVSLRMSFMYPFATPTGSYGILGVKVFSPNGTEKYIVFYMLFTHFIGLDKVMTEAELNNVTPEPGTVILSGDIAQVSNITSGENVHELVGRSDLIDKSNLQSLSGVNESA